MIINFSPIQKISLAIIFDCLMIIFSFYLSISLRYETLYPKSIIASTPFYYSLLITFIIQLTTFINFGFYKGIWRYASTHDLMRLIKGISFASILNGLVLFLVFRLEGIPRSSLFIDWMLLILSLGGSRFLYRIFKDDLFSIKSSSYNSSKVLIIGAGSAGEQLCKEIKRNSALSYHIVGFLDDDRYKKSKTLHGIPVLGAVREIQSVVTRKNIDQIFIAIPSSTVDAMKIIVKKCQEVGIKIKTLPKMTDIIEGNIAFTQLRKIKLEDLMGRKEIFLDQNSIKTMLMNKIIFVSGAGGSIGRELVTQVIKFYPKKLILADISEENLFNLKNIFKNKVIDIELIFIIEDIRNVEGLNDIFKMYRPEIIFHAAAYKHVPLMEENPNQAIKTNIFGTLNLTKMAIKYAAEKFVMVSTDKAVNPTNIMGTTKRIAELICQKLQQNNNLTDFITVRFGNVLGSSGSVIPIFKKQILDGGPLTVTHPKIQRYFMSIPEAAQLILQAGTIGKGGEILHLDMGEPVKIIEIAKQMIKLANLTEGKDISIKITGLRPGEKLYEELLAHKENSIPTHHPLVRISKTVAPQEDIIKKVENITSSFNCKKEIQEELLQLVPEYDPDQKQNFHFLSSKNEREQLQ